MTFIISSEAEGGLLRLGNPKSNVGLLVVEVSCCRVPFIQYPSPGEQCIIVVRNPMRVEQTNEDLNIGLSSSPDH